MTAKEIHYETVSVTEDSTQSSPRTLVSSHDADAPSPAASTVVVHEDEHIAPPTLAEKKRRLVRRRAWYAHMVLISLAEFAAESARGMVLPTLFSYSKQLGGDLVFMGLLTALFSAGRFCSSLVMGWVSDRVSFRLLYYASALFAIVGNVLYILPYSPRIKSKTLLGVSRFVVGFGAGNRSVCRANIAALTRVDQRLEYFTFFAMVVFLSYALTPGLGGAFGDTDTQLGSEYFQFNHFTAPGYILVGINLLTIAVTAVVFDESITRDDAPGTADYKSKAVATSSVPKAQSDIVIPERLATIGILVFIFQNFNARGILSIFETINVPLYLLTIQHTSEASASSFTTTSEAAQFYFAVGLLGLITYACVQMIGKRVSDVSFLLVGFVMLLIGNIILFALSASLLPSTASSLSPEAPPSTNTSQDSALPFQIFVLAEIFIWSIGCPLTSAVVVSAFSKVLGTRPQGALMGIFGSSASIARMILPFLPGILPSWESLFAVNMGLCATCIIVLVVYLRVLKKSTMHAAIYEGVSASSPSLMPA